MVKPRFLKEVFDTTPIVLTKNLPHDLEKGVNILLIDYVDEVEKV